MSQLANIRGIFDCYVAPGKAYLTRALHRHLAVNSPWRLLGGRVTVKFFFLLGIKKWAKEASSSLKILLSKVETQCRLGCPACCCDSRSCRPSGLIVAQQKVVPCSGLKSWRPPVPFLKSLSQASKFLPGCSPLVVPVFLALSYLLAWQEGVGVLSWPESWMGVRRYCLGQPTVLRPPVKSSTEQYARSCLHLCSKVCSFFRDKGNASTSKQIEQTSLCS